MTRRRARYWVTWVGGSVGKPLPLPQVDEPEEEVVEEEEGKEDDRAKVKMRPSTVRRLVRRRQKVREEDLKQKPVTFRELLKLNLPDWPLVLIGVIMSAIIGVLFPLQAILFSDILRVRSSGCALLTVPLTSVPPSPPPIPHRCTASQMLKQSRTLLWKLWEGSWP